MTEIAIQIYTNVLPSFSVPETSENYWRELWAHEQILNLHAMAQAGFTIQEATDFAVLLEGVQQLEQLPAIAQAIKDLKLQSVVFTVGGRKFEFDGRILTETSS